MADGAQRKSRILIVGNNVTSVKLLEAFLAEVQCDIAVAADGRETSDQVAAFKPDLILLDVKMSNFNGFEVCWRLKHDPATRDIIILTITARSELGDIQRAVEAGTDDFLSKPVNKAELVKRVENMLKLAL